MKHRERKIQMTVRLTPATHKRAREIEHRSGTPVAVVVAEAAREALLTEPFETAAMRADRFQQTVLNRLQVLEHAVLRELLLVREALGTLLRIYLNHTPAVPETERQAAALSGQIRMQRALQLIHRNVAAGVSIFDAPAPRSEADDVA